jgi:hypothetical protein
MYAVPYMAVFCSSLLLCFPGTLMRYFLNYFDMFPAAHTITALVLLDYYYHYYCYYYCIIVTFINLSIDIFIVCLIKNFFSSCSIL